MFSTSKLPPKISKLELKLRGEIDSATRKSILIFGYVFENIGGPSLREGARCINESWVMAHKRKASEKK
jgi:hypothetical protein